MHLFTGTDRKYLSFAIGLLGSYRAVNPGRMFVYGVGLNSSDLATLSNRGISVIEDRVPESCSLPVFVACERISAVRHALLDAPGESVLLLDADSIVRKSLSEIDHLIASADLGLCFRGGNDPNRQLYSGFVALRSTPGTLAFLDSYARQLTRCGLRWYADQRALYQAYLETSDSGATTFASLPHSLLSRQLRDRACIWSPSPTWRRRQKYLTAVANGHRVLGITMTSGLGMQVPEGN